MTFYYFDIEQKIPNNQEIKFEDNLSSGLLGYKSLLKIIRYLRNDINDQETKHFLEEIKIKYSLNYDRIDKSKLQKKEQELIEHFISRQKQLNYIKRMNNFLIVILDGKLEKEMEKLETLETLINNEDLKNRINLLRELNYQNLSNEDKSLLAMYDKIVKSIYYIKNIKIGKGENIKFVAKDKDNWTDLYVYDYLEDVSKEIKYSFSDVITEQKELNNLMDLWIDSKYDQVLKELENKLDEEMNEDISEKYLYPKLINALSKLLGLSTAESNILVENDPNFRTKVFANLDLEMIIRELKTVEKELTECKKVERYVNDLYKKIYFCPACTYSSEYKKFTVKHTQGIHKELKIKVDDIDENSKIQSIYTYKLMKDDEEYLSFFSDKRFSSKDECIAYTKTNYIKETSLIKQLPFVMSIKISNKNTLENIKKIMNKAKSINNTLEKCNGSNVLNKMNKELKYRKTIEYYKKNYSNYVKYDLITEKELNNMINKVIKIEDLKESYHREINSNILTQINLDYNFNNDIYEEYEDILKEKLLPNEILKNKNILNQELDKYVDMLTLSIDNATLRDYHIHYNKNILDFITMLQKILIYDDSNDRTSFKYNFILNEYNKQVAGQLNINIKQKINKGDDMKKLFVGGSKKKKNKLEVYSLHYVTLLVLLSYTNHFGIFYDFLEQNTEKKGENVEKTKYWTWKFNEDKIYDKLQGIIDEKDISLIIDELDEKMMETGDIKDIFMEIQEKNVESKDNQNIFNELSNLKKQLDLMRKLVINRYVSIKRLGNIIKKSGDIKGIDTKEILDTEHEKRGILKMFHIDMWALEQISDIFGNNELINDLILRFLKLNKIIYTKKDKEVGNKINIDMSKEIKEDLEKYKSINDLTEDVDNNIINIDEENEVFGDIEDFEY